ncbi:hypothetical protein H0H92_009233 [Tricholoma furcatifolium]|nr:hypothetical protein H0H92_009233 [Tricholoma furcatifolium]
MDAVRDVIDRLQRPIPDLSTLLSLLCSPLASIGLLPPQYHKHNTSPLPDGLVNIRKHIPSLQRALLDYIAPTWDSLLAENNASVLLDQYFCPDSFSFAYSSAGDVAIHAYSTITSQALTQYGIRLLAQLASEYPVDRLYVAIMTVNEGDEALRLLAWEDCVRSVLVVPAKVSNAMAGEKTSPPDFLEHGTYFNNVSLRTEALIYSLSAKRSKDVIPPLTYLFSKLVNLGVFPLTPPTSRSQPSFFQATTPLIRARLASEDAATYTALWASLFSGLGSALILRSLITSLLASIPPLARPTDAALSQRIAVKVEARLLNGITGSISPERDEVWETVLGIVLGKEWDAGLARIFVCWISGGSSGESPNKKGLYVAHLDPSVRRCGMLAAEVVAKRVGKKLDFGDWDGDDSGKPWARALRELLSARDVDVDIDAELPRAVSKETVEDILVSAIPTRVTVNQPSTGYDSDDSITGYASSSSSRSASPTPSELSDIEKDPTLNVGVKKVPRPVYLAQLGDLLRNTGGQKANTDPHDADKIEMALNYAEELIRKKRGYGTELDENVVNLVYALLGLQDNFDLEDFEVKRQGALNALIASAPRKAAPALIEEFFKNQYSTSQRYVALNALALGAREMASLPLPPSTSRIAPERISFPSKMLPSSLHQRYIGMGEQNIVPLIMDSISNRAIDKQKEASADKVPELVRERRLRINKGPSITEMSQTNIIPAASRPSALPQKLTPFIEVATEYFIAPLINQFWLFLRDERTREERTAHQQGRQQYHGAGTGLILNPVVLSQFLGTLGILVHASQNAPEWMAVVAPDALELAVTVGARPVSRIETDVEDDEKIGGQRGKEASVLTAALELALVVLDGCLEIDGGRVIGLEHTSLLLGAGEWAGAVFAQLDKGVRVQGGGGAHETKLRRAAAGVLLKIDDLTAKWRRSMLDTR